MPRAKPKAKAPPAPSEPETLPEPSLNLLEAQIITVRTPGGITMMSLPELYAAMTRNNAEDLVHVRPHQRHPVHSTLCQIGAVAMVNAGLTVPLDNPEGWRDILSYLTEQEYPGEEPWHLVVPSITDAAFLQPPASSKDKIKEYKKVLATPDTMDITVGSKRHDVKDGTMSRARPEHWLYALITSQTAGGVEGKEIYGVSRMNKGLGSRHGFSVTPDTRWDAHVTRDMKLLAERYRGENVESHLLWTRKWDGTKKEALDPQDLHPSALYVEAGRRIRLVGGTGGISHALRAGTKGTRIEIEETLGRTEDPWTLTEPQKSVTVSENGFGFREISRYLEPEKYILPELAVPRESDGSTVMLVARTIVRGQGMTHGYHEREIPLTGYVTRILRTPDGRRILAKEVTERTNLVAEVSSILRHAVKTYLQNGISNDEARREHEKIINRYGHRLQQEVDPSFWKELQDGLESENPELAQAEWVHRSLAPRARRILESAQSTGMCNLQDRFKARARSEDVFSGRISTSKKLPKRPGQEERRSQ